MPGHSPDATPDVMRANDITLAIGYPTYITRGRCLRFKQIPGSRHWQGSFPSLLLAGNRLQVVRKTSACDATIGL